MVVPKPDSFSNSKEKYIVPHSEEVKTCHTCSGIGQVTCFSCGGLGGRYENHTNSDGTSSSHWDACASCSGSGRVKCTSCSDREKVKWYVILIVEWKKISKCA